MCERGLVDNRSVLVMQLSGTGPRFHAESINVFPQTLMNNYSNALVH